MILAVSATGAQAHSGSIGLYTEDTGPTDCDCDVPPFSPWEVFVFYLRSDDGPDGIHGAEFKVEVSDPLVALTAFTKPANSLTAGTIDTGIAITFLDGCRGSGSSYVYLGTIGFYHQNVYD